MASRSRADEYRRRAQQCLELARTFGDRRARASLSYMAEAWLRLADITAPEQQRQVQQQQHQQPIADGWELAGAEDYSLAEAVWRAAIKCWPGATIILRQGARAVHDSRRPPVVE